MLRQLRDEIYLASVGDDLVALDVRNGVYGCLPLLGEAVGPADAFGQVEIASSQVADLISDAGWLAEDTSVAALRFGPHLPAPSASAWRTGVELVTTTDRHRMAQAYIDVTRHFWLRSFGHIVEYAAERRGQALAPDETPVVRHARVFDQMMPAVPFQGVCLFRSFMLLSYLHRAGRQARWVIGVQTYPFLAHCWLQVGDTVLDDAAERVCGFIPIVTI